MKRQRINDPRTNKLRKNKLVEKIVPGADGLIRDEGKVIFVPGVLPGEEIDFKILEEKKKFSRGICTHIHKSSADRIAAECPLYGSCGGCNFQHLKYEKQLEAKTMFLRDMFKKMAGIELAENLEFTPSKPFAYRQRIQIHSDGQHVGFKARRKDSIISVKNCPILLPSLNQYLKSSDPSAFIGRKTLFATDNTVFEDSDKREIAIEIEGRQLFFRADLFFQSNALILKDLLDSALQNLQGDNVLDLYCGVGLFSVFLRDNFSKITAIEINPEAESFYRKNMEGYDYDYFAMSLEEWLKKGFYKRTAPVDAIVLDPPRTGLSDSVRTFLSDHPVDNLIYVSCDPATQARDTKSLLQSGYKIETVRGFDFYPQTNHMESLVRFIR
ncbi:MAG: hypothetical protein B6241_03855 [Spirochaetaceae bacterium 4572_59]|nr:MAG: hypothetical protein B6241_03855 [Spirochaetaceae bacterium 4572_59]